MSNYSSLMAAESAGMIVSLVLSIISILLGICVIIMIWWVEIKKQPIGKIGSAIGNRLYDFFDKFNDLITNNLPVQTVYSDKTLNYSGTEFLPVPSKAPTKQYTYTFLGWDKNSVDEKGNTVVRAIYLQKVKTVTVNFYNYDKDTLLKTFEVEYGAGVDVSDIVPERKESNEFAYEFVGWDKETLAFYENTNVYAVFKALPKKFNYTFFDDDGKSVISKGYAIYGTPITPPKTPVKYAENGKVYEFSGWKNYTENMILTKDVEFFAEYSNKKVSGISEEPQAEIEPVKEEPKENLTKAKTQVENKNGVIISRKQTTKKPETKAKVIKVEPSDEKGEDFMQNITVISPNTNIVSKESDGKVIKLKPKSDDK